MLTPKVIELSRGSAYRRPSQVGQTPPARRPESRRTATRERAALSMNAKLLR
jgi:hypothetical protein